jgi:hypothetical protein
MVLLIIVRSGPPNLPAETKVVIDDSDTDAALGRTSGRGHARWPSSNDKNVEMMSRSAHYLFTSRCLLPCLVRTGFGSSGNAIARR